LKQSIEIICLAAHGKIKNGAGAPLQPVLHVIPGVAGLLDVQRVPAPFRAPSRAHGMDV
jgi:hypothetical protein